jgi:dihydrofolate reductase
LNCQAADLVKFLFLIWQAMIISLIVAASENNVIGKDNHLLWRLPNDMRFFKNTTWAMPVIMGRKTFESFSGSELPGRFNIVVTRQKELKNRSDKVKIADNLNGAIALAKETDCKEIFVIGGGQIYAESMAIADNIYLTRFHTSLPGDTYFPSIDPSIWELESNVDFPADENHQYAYSFQVWLRKK